MDALAVVQQRIFLFRSPEIRHVGCNQRELTGEDFRRFGHTPRSHCQFVCSPFLAFLRQDLFQQRLEFMEISYQQILLSSARVDQTAQHRSLWSADVPLHSIPEPLVITRHLQPVGFSRVRRWLIRRFIAGTCNGRRGAMQPAPD